MLHKQQCLHSKKFEKSFVLQFVFWAFLDHLPPPALINIKSKAVTLHQMLKNSYNFFVLQHCILQRNILNVSRRVQTCPDMPFKTFKKPPNLDAVVTEAILNSPLLQRKRVVLEPSLDNYRGTSILGEVHNVEISRTTQQLLNGKSYDFSSRFCSSTLKNH